MPETFTVDVCYEKPCHWTPKPIYGNTAPRPDGHHSQVTNGNLPLPALPGAEQHPKVKRAPQHDLEPQTDPRQGPPQPEPPHTHQNGETIPATQVVEDHAMSDVDPEVEQLAINRQEATQASQKNSRPESFGAHMDSRYILRPEAIESVFYMWRITGDPIWQDKGWQMWESIENATWTELAYSAINDVNQANSPKADSMER